jgi:hypothetical protein
VFVVGADMAMGLPNISRDSVTIGRGAITMGRASFLLSAKYSAIAPVGQMDLAAAIRFNRGEFGFQTLVSRRQRCRNICWFSS